MQETAAAHEALARVLAVGDAFELTQIFVAVALARARRGVLPRVDDGVLPYISLETNSVFCACRRLNLVVVCGDSTVIAS
jgi:hypothetical protein